MTSHWAGGYHNDTFSLPELTKDNPSAQPLIIKASVWQWGEEHWTLRELAQDYVRRIADSRL